ncbi:hypothetical protein EV130_103171 [Rhizobium azibense]|uniref:Uncharacterized protein n=2 Tax=Rhizobium azibense TaxID=1136135 RepID=A0A4R3RIK7_9HYPH|nr:hypothetical protein EV130_103171 [Rhizobium azibense]TCU34554.1 hypothetical protein EV129_112171 [Rhizobium azibense]
MTVSVLISLMPSMTFYVSVHPPRLVSRRRKIKDCFTRHSSKHISPTLSKALKFEVAEAEDIIFGGRIPNDRPADAHDIRGTFDIVSSPEEMVKTPKTVDEFIELLKHRHALMMGGRPETMPGQFKSKSNRAGGTTFVRPDEVLGTFDKGFEIYSRLDVPFDRAHDVHGCGGSSLLRRKWPIRAYHDEC